jgi:hypothetical protein
MFMISNLCLCLNTAFPFRWKADMDVFVLGAYAALSLGPGAANLMGARTAAVAVSNSLYGRSCPKSRDSTSSSSSHVKKGSIKKVAVEAHVAPDGVCVKESNWLEELQGIVASKIGRRVQKSGRKSMHSK